MNAFETNILAMYGDRGYKWLRTLPMRIERLAAHYHLHNLREVQNLSYNYVMLGNQGNTPIVLKIGLDTASLKRESTALKAFAGYGSIAVLAAEEGVLLLEQAIPGTPLKSYEPANERIHIACNVMKHLHQSPLPANSFPHIKDWLSTLNKEWDLPPHLLNTARALRDQHLAKDTQPILLHGDLHGDNILKNGTDWLIIDPKGVIGSPIYEVSAFITDREQDIPIVADFFGFSVQEIYEWHFIRLVLASAWSLEDHTDATSFLELAAQTYPYVIQK